MKNGRRKAAVKQREDHKIPRPYGFKVAVFPVKIAKASAGCTRPVAIIE